MEANKYLALISEALAIEAEEARRAGKLGYMARALVQATMPHKHTSENEFTRSNGTYTLTMQAPSKLGLPHGALPRLLLAWVTTEAVRTRDPVLVLGPSLSGFMEQLDLVPTGGRWGSITRLRTQMVRLFSCTVSCHYEAEDRTEELGFRVTKEYRLWWHPQRPEQAALWQSTVTLSREFFEEIIASPVPIDMRVLKALRRSPLCLDIYGWLTYRMSYLSARTEIPWPALAAQFGAEYKRMRDFKAAFLEHLTKVLTVYRHPRVETGESGLILRPSKTHIPLAPRG